MMKTAHVIGVGEACMKRGLAGRERRLSKPPLAALLPLRGNSPSSTAEGYQESSVRPLAPGLSAGSGPESGIRALRPFALCLLCVCCLPVILPCFPLRTLLGIAVEPEAESGAGAWVRSASLLCWDLSPCQQTRPTAAGEPGRTCWGSS